MSNLNTNKNRIETFLNNRIGSATPMDIRDSVLLVKVGISKDSIVNHALQSLVKEGRIKRFDQGPHSSVYRSN